MPFLDRKLLNIALQIPARYRVGKELTKLALREYAKTKLPPETAANKKKGFQSPLHNWLKQDCYYHRVKEKFNSNLATTFFNPDYLLQLLEQHRQGKTPAMKLIQFNIRLLKHLSRCLSSQYIPEIVSDDILFIEDALQGIDTVERSFSLLKVNGVFDKIGGLIIGKHELLHDKSSGRKYYGVLLEVIGIPKIPILAKFDSGHKNYGTRKLKIMLERKTKRHQSFFISRLKIGRSMRKYGLISSYTLKLQKTKKESVDNDHVGNIVNIEFNQRRLKNLHRFAFVLESRER